MRSFDIKIDTEPYLFAGEGIVLGDALTEPAPPRELGSALLENVVTGLGPRVARGNGYYNAHRLIPTIEGQLIFHPKAAMGSQHVMTGGAEYTPGVHHHPFGNAGAQYIAYGKQIYAIFLSDIVPMTYTECTGADPTGAPISNAFARYTGGAFIWRNSIYFGIENALTGQAIGYSYIDMAVSPTVVTVRDDTEGKGFSYGASGRGRLFIARNQSNVLGLDPLELRWSPDMANDYNSATFSLYGDFGTFNYAIENRPRVTWVSMIGSAAIFMLANGGALASDETGFLGIIAPPSAASASEDNAQGFGAVPYLDGLAYRVNFGGPLHLNPVTLVTRSMSPGNLQDLSVENNDVTIRCMTSIGEHLLYAGDRYLYEVVWTGNTPVLHKHMDFSQFAGIPAGFVPGAMTYQGGLLVITFINTTTARLIHTQWEPIPSINTSTTAYSGASIVGFLEPGILIGPSRAAHMTKLWLQVRGAYYTRINSGNALSFTNCFVDGTKGVSIAPVTSIGPWASAITASPQLNRLGRTLEFRLNMSVAGYTGFDERLYTPIVADFLWCPTNTDMLTLTLIASAEQQQRVGGLWAHRSAVQIRDALHAKQYTVITVEFGDGPSATTWTMFVEAVDSARVGESGAADSGYGSDSYIVKMACRRLA